MFAIEVNHLRHDEVIHELVARGIEATRLADDNREILRQLKSREREVETFPVKVFKTLSELRIFAKGYFHELNM